SAKCQAAVLAALKRARAPQVPAMLLADWAHKAPSLRQAGLEVLLSRDEWLPELLASLEKGTIVRSEISPADRQRLLKHNDLDIRRRAEALWNDSSAASRAAILARYQSVTTAAGDASKGAVIFANVCATCHALHGQGHNVGPNL